MKQNYVMKKLLIWISLILSIYGISHAENISNWESVISINTDWSFEVSENIYYNFGKYNKHWIYRDVPTKFFYNNDEYYFKIKINKIFNEHWVNYKYSKDNFSQWIRIKIWDPDKYVTWKNNYIINYIVFWWLKYFKTHDEFHWNITWNWWNIPISKVKLIINNSNQFNAYETECFTWLSWSMKKDCSYTNSGNKIIFTTSKALGPKSGITVKFKLNKWAVDSLVYKKGFYWYFMEFGLALIIPILTLYFMYKKWLKIWKDPKQRQYIAPFYTPPKDLSAAEIWCLYDDKSDSKDLVATIIELAVKGYIKIKEEKKLKLLFWNLSEYKIIKMKQYDWLLLTHENILLKWIFTKNRTERLLWELSRDLVYWLALKKFNEKIYSKLTVQWYYVSNPELVKGKYIWIWILLVVVWGFLLAINAWLGYWAWLWWFITFLFWFIMPAKTKKWIEALEHILWFQLYLDKVEKKYLDFHNAPEKKPELFEKFLPYAIALRVEKAWAKEFTDVKVKTPNWYSWWSVNNFNIWSFTDSLGAFSASTSTSSNWSSSGSWGWSWGWGGWSW